MKYQVLQGLKNLLKFFDMRLEHVFIYNELSCAVSRKFKLCLSERGRERKSEGDSCKEGEHSLFTAKELDTSTFTTTPPSMG